MLVLLGSILTSLLHAIPWTQDRALLAGEGVVVAVLLVHPATRQVRQPARCRLCGAAMPPGRSARTIAHHSCRHCYAGLLLVATPEIRAQLNKSGRLPREAWIATAKILHDAVLHGCREPRDVAELRIWLRAERVRQEAMARIARRMLGGYFGTGAAALAIAAAALDNVRRDLTQAIGHLDTKIERVGGNVQTMMWVVLAGLLVTILVQVFHL